MENSNSENSFSFSYQTLLNAIIRPPRSNKYTSEDLSNHIFAYKKKEYTRTDYIVINKLNQRLQCSFFQPLESFRKCKKMPVVIYLHGNSSSRQEGMTQVPLLLKHNINVFLFDFSGSGLSDGEYISLGYREKDDLECVIKFVQKLEGVSNIGLWGRSMGAATALMYLSKDNNNIKASVIDSPFADFKLLIQQQCQKLKVIPEFLVNFAFYIVQNSIKEKCGFSIDKLKPIENANLCICPAFFIHAMNDDLIPLEHTISIFEKYGGIKSLNVCSGGHHSTREKTLSEKIANFLEENLYK